jgi:hypothetical protein
VPGTFGDLLPDILRHVGCLPDVLCRVGCLLDVLRRVGCLGSASFSAASASVAAAGSTSSVRMTKKIEWVVVNRARGNMVIFIKTDNVDSFNGVALNRK